MLEVGPGRRVRLVRRLEAPLICLDLAILLLDQRFVERLDVALQPRRGVRRRQGLQVVCTVSLTLKSVDARPVRGATGSDDVAPDSK